MKKKHCCDSCKEGKPCEGEPCKDSALNKAIAKLFDGQPTEEKDALQDCVSRKVSIFAHEHPDWENDHCVAAAYGYCRAHKELKAMSAIDETTGGALVGDDDETKLKKKSYRISCKDAWGEIVVLDMGDAVPPLAKDFRIIDQRGKVHDNRTFQDFAMAEKMLGRLGKK